MGDDMSMPMYFMNTMHTTLWFKSWETKTPGQYVLSLVGLVLLAIVHEAIACYRSCYLAGQAPGAGLQEPLVGLENPRPSHILRMRSDKVWAAVLYSLNICSGYLLMLAVMTFNTGYFFAVVLGMGVGYYVMFDVMSRSAQSRSDSCHAHRENGRA